MVTTMAITEVGICNMALARIRANPIGEFNEESPQAEKCRIFYPESRDLVLSEVDWPFNKKTVTLALKPYEPAEWKYAYSYPNDCLMVRYLLPRKDSTPGYESRTALLRGNLSESREIEYDVELDDNNSRVIVTNEPEARLVYSIKVEEVRLYGQMVSDLMAWRLAMDLAIDLGGDAGRKYRIEAENQYNKLLIKAEARYLNQSRPRQRQEVPRSVRARLGRPGYEQPLRK